MNKLQDRPKKTQEEKLAKLLITNTGEGFPDELWLNGLDKFKLLITDLLRLGRGLQMNFAWNCETLITKLLNY